MQSTIRFHAPFNEHIEADGPTVFAHACKMGLEGIVSKRKDSPYRSGRSARNGNQRPSAVRISFAVVTAVELRSSHLIWLNLEAPACPGFFLSGE